MAVKKCSKEISHKRSFMRDLQSIHLKKVSTKIFCSFAISFKMELNIIHDTERCIYVQFGDFGTY